MRNPPKEVLRSTIVNSAQTGMVDPMVEFSLPLERREGKTVYSHYSGYLSLKNSCKSMIALTARGEEPHIYQKLGIG